MNLSTLKIGRLLYGLVFIVHFAVYFCVDNSSAEHDQPRHYGRAVELSQGYSFRCSRLGYSGNLCPPS
jgi:hypothetical protein